MDVTLTDEEREALGDAWEDESTFSPAAFYPVVERIVAARLAAVEALHHERGTVPESCRCGHLWPCPTIAAVRG
jgi:hypothetical protein